MLLTSVIIRLFSNAIDFHVTDELDLVVHKEENIPEVELKPTEETFLEDEFEQTRKNFSEVGLLNYTEFVGGKISYKDDSRN